MGIKIPGLLSLLLIGLPSVLRSQVLLNAGDSYTYEFTHFTLLTTTVFPPRAGVSLGFRDYYFFDSGDTFLFEAFETSTNESPIFSTNYTAGAGSPYFGFPSAWQDMQGVFRVTMLSGSAILPGFGGQVISTNGFWYALKVDLQPHLNVSTGGSQIRLTWTTNAFEFALTSTDNIRLGLWRFVPDARTVSNGEFVVELPPSVSQRYFRLEKNFF